MTTTPPDGTARPRRLGDLPSFARPPWSVPSFNNSAMPETRSKFAPLSFGHYPTPVRRLDALCTDAAELWLKNDGLTHPVYGGNKVRKLEWIVGRALGEGRKRLVTFGCAGSHHALATAVFGKLHGLEVAVALLPQLRTAHAEETFRATLGTGAEIVPLSSPANVARALTRLLREGDLLVPPGGSSPEATWGYVSAVDELAEQIRTRVCPEPDIIVAPLGSAGTVAGLLAGVGRNQLSTRVVGVTIFRPRAAARPLVIGLAGAALYDGPRSTDLEALSRALWVEPRFVGKGYGHPTPEGMAATSRASELDLILDPTYTAKTFAAALDIAARAVRTGERPLRVLYWHTLSATSTAPLLAHSPESIPRALASLLT